MIKKNKGLKHTLKNFFKGFWKLIISNVRFRKLWIFGTILIAFSIFVDPKLIIVIFFMMALLTLGTLNEIKKLEKDEIIVLSESKKEIEKILIIMKEHIDGGQASMDEKLDYEQLQEELKEINFLLNERKADNKGV